MPLIKRYPNRKLYDTEAKRYVTLNEIAALVRAGEDIRVLDYASGQDLTTLILSQVILEQERLEGGFLPRAILSELVRLGGSRVGKIRQALRSTFDGEGEFERELGRRFELLVQQGELGAQEADALLEKLRSLGEMPPPGLAGEAEARLAVLLKKYNFPTRSELQPLEETLEALEAQVNSLAED